MNICVNNSFPLGQIPHIEQITQCEICTILPSQIPRHILTPTHLSMGSHAHYLPSLSQQSFKLAQHWPSFKSLEMEVQKGGVSGPRIILLVCQSFSPTKCIPCL